VLERGVDDAEEEVVMSEGVKQRARLQIFINLVRWPLMDDDDKLSTDNEI
jgi:hypothetical protein